MELQKRFGCDFAFALTVAGSTSTVRIIEVVAKATRSVSILRHLFMIVFKSESGQIPSLKRAYSKS